MAGKFVIGTLFGFGLSGFSSVWCEAPKRTGVSPDGLTNYSFEGVALPTKEDLGYVKTWGVPWVSDWDRPGARGIRADRSRLFKRQIILIRHGQYQNESVADDRIRCLTPLGEQQARLTGEYLWNAFVQSGIKREDMLRNTSHGVTSDNLSTISTAVMKTNSENYMGGFLIMDVPKFIHVSDMTRAQQTAKLMLEAFPSNLRKRLATDPFLRERYPCDPEPRRRRASATYDDMRLVEKVFEKYFHRPVADESSVEVIVGHANVIRYLVCRALQLPPEAWLRLSLPHCSITSLIISGNGHVSLSCLGSAGHLPVDMITTRNIS